MWRLNGRSPPDEEGISHRKVSFVSWCARGARGARAGELGRRWCPPVMGRPHAGHTPLRRYPGGQNHASFLFRTRFTPRPLTSDRHISAELPLYCLPLPPDYYWRKPGSFRYYHTGSCVRLPRQVGGENGTIRALPNQSPAQLNRRLHISGTAIGRPPSQPHPAPSPGRPPLPQPTIDRQNAVQSPLPGTRMAGRFQSSHEPSKRAIIHAEIRAA